MGRAHRACPAPGRHEGRGGLPEGADARSCGLCVGRYDDGGRPCHAHPPIQRRSARRRVRRLPAGREGTREAGLRARKPELGRGPVGSGGVAHRARAPLRSGRASGLHVHAAREASGHPHGDLREGWRSRRAISNPRCVLRALWAPLLPRGASWPNSTSCTMLASSATRSTWRCGRSSSTRSDEVA